MLANNFLSAKQLGCTEADLRAAITVLGMLERSELVGKLSVRYWWYSDPECGTIGAHCELEAFRKEDIFCPHNWLGGNYTIPHCAKALRAKLTTGYADWSIDV